MTFAEFDRYVEADALVSSSHRVLSPCADCTVGFAEAMRAKGVCDSEPQAGRIGRPRKVFVPVLLAPVVEGVAA